MRTTFLEGRAARAAMTCTAPSRVGAGLSMRHVGLRVRGDTAMIVHPVRAWGPASGRWRCLFCMFMTPTCPLPSLPPPAPSDLVHRQLTRVSTLHRLFRPSMTRGLSRQDAEAPLQPPARRSFKERVRDGGGRVGGWVGRGVRGQGWERPEGQGGAGGGRAGAWGQGGERRAGQGGADGWVSERARGAGLGATPKLTTSQHGRGCRPAAACPAWLAKQEACHAGPCGHFTIGIPHQAPL